MADMNAAWQTASQEMYAASGAGAQAGAGPNAGGPAGGSNPGNGDATDVEYEEVKK